MPDTSKRARRTFAKARKDAELRKAFRSIFGDRPPFIRIKAWNDTTIVAGNCTRIERGHDGELVVVVDRATSALTSVC